MMLDCRTQFQEHDTCCLGDVCVFLSLFCFPPEEFVEQPRQILSPWRTLGCWRVDKSSCLSQPSMLIRSSTSKDWIMACCPHARRSLPCCRTAGDKQSVLNLRVSGRKKEFRKQSVQSAGDRRMMCLHWHLHNWDVLVQQYIYNCGVPWLWNTAVLWTIDVLPYMNFTCAMNSHDERCIFYLVTISNIYILYMFVCVWNHTFSSFGKKE